MNALTNVAKSNNRHNRTRSVLLIISILLTTLGLTVISTWGYAIIQTNKNNAGILYGRYDGIYAGITKDQLHEMELKSAFAKIGKMEYVGEVENERSISLYATDQVLREHLYMDDMLEEGRFPTWKDEIIGSRAFYSSLGYESVQVGDSITVSYRPDLTSKYADKEFRVSGILNAQGDANSILGYVSEEYYTSTVAEEDQSYMAYFLLDKNEKVNSHNAMEVLKELASDCGIDTKRVSLNRAYVMWARNPGTETILVCVVIILIIIMLSLVVIYNIFQVGMKQRVWEYGKIKAMGATKKQLRRIIRKEALYLGAIGIPLGLLFGYVIAKISFQWLVKQVMGIQGNRLDNVSLFQVPIFLLVAVLSLITILLAIRKPMKIISKTTIVEAMRYQEQRKARGIRKGKKQVTVMGLTMANMSGNRRRTISTIITLGLSCVLFVVMANSLGNMDDAYEARKIVERGKIYVYLTYSLNDTAYPENNLDSILKEDPLDQEFLQQVREIEGVTEIYTNKIVLAADEKQNPITIGVLNREEFSRYKAKAGKVGNLDYDAASKEGAIIYGWGALMETYCPYSVGDQVPITLENGTKIEPNLQGAFGSISSDWAVTEDTYQAWNLGEDHIAKVWIDCTTEQLRNVEKKLNEILLGVDHVEIKTYESALKETQLSMKMITVGIYALLILTGLIGFMNMANTMVTSITTRRQEFGVLQAIGMTSKQLSHMLQLEGVIFTIGTVFVSLTVGIPLGYAVFQYGKNNGYIGLHTYHFPTVEVLCMIGCILVLQIVLAYVLSKNIKKNSIVERVRYQE
ncbi:ABC transporter permease [Anaerosporobacter faecicola]|uniref:ABC transporter permease n=1 Tax=Anaerosporobacter faecicola TaxID=2718714 RepID=UPI00143BD2DD|nr:ABC transporter permease [Anaerosporobacter faecicola]